jgi:hypothetical protein
LAAAAAAAHVSHIEQAVGICFDLGAAVVMTSNNQNVNKIV